MKKKMIFIFPGYYGFDVLILEGFRKHTNFDIIHIDPTKNYMYNNFFERILNFISKIFFRINLKEKYLKEKHILKKLEESSKIDLIFVNRPDLLSEKILFKLKQKCNKRIVLFWDSFEKIPNTKIGLKYFNQCFTFDFNDSMNYNIPLISNFFIDYDECKCNKEIIFDFFYIGTYDDRYEKLITIFDNLVERGYKCCGVIYNKNIKNIKHKKKYFTYTDEIIPFKESFKYGIQSKYILDVSHKNQSGLSFRVFEALGLSKKLITTNKEIIKQDFYHENNIFIMEDVDIPIPKSFFEKEYIVIDKKIMNQYTQKQLIKKLLA